MRNIQREIPEDGWMFVSKLTNGTIFCLVCCFAIVGLLESSAGRYILIGLSILVATGFVLHKRGEYLEEKARVPDGVYWITKITRDEHVPIQVCPGIIGDNDSPTIINPQEIFLHLTIRDEGGNETILKIDPQFDIFNPSDESEELLIEMPIKRWVYDEDLEEMVEVDYMDKLLNEMNEMTDLNNESGQKVGISSIMGSNGWFYSVDIL